MKNLIKISLLALFLVFTTTGCRSTKIVNVPTQTVAEKITQKDMYKAIMRAGHRRGWEMTKVADGVIDATYARRGFTATCTITYTANSYKIDYKSSTGLKYDEKKQTIHKNYNSWIQNLKKEINMEVHLLQ